MENGLGLERRDYSLFSIIHYPLPSGSDDALEGGGFTGDVAVGALEDLLLGVLLDVSELAVGDDEVELGDGVLFVGGEEVHDARGGHDGGAAEEDGGGKADEAAHVLAVGWDVLAAVVLKAHDLRNVAGAD